MKNAIIIIIEKVRNHEYEFTIPHFFEEMANDDLLFADIEMAMPMVASTVASHATRVALVTRFMAQRQTDDRLQSFAGSKRLASCCS